MTNDLEHNPEANTSEDGPIEYGTSRYWDELYVPDGKLPREEEMRIDQEAVEKYMSTLDPQTSATITRYLIDARVTPYTELLERNNPKEIIETLRNAMLRLMYTMQDTNGREKGLFIAKELEAINLIIAHLRRESYDAMFPTTQ